MDLNTLARIERTHNKLTVQLRDYLDRYSNDELLVMSEERLTDQLVTERTIVAITYLTELLRRFEIDAMYDNDGRPHDDNP